MKMADLTELNACVHDTATPDINSAGTPAQVNSSTGITVNKVNKVGKMIN